MNVQPIRSESIVETPSTKAKSVKPEVSNNDVPRDSFTTEQREKLKGVLQNQPSARPDVVDRGRELAKDPAYPPKDVVKNIANALIKET
jgi:hypothetical protein